MSDRIFRRRDQEEENASQEEEKTTSKKPFIDPLKFIRNAGEYKFLRKCDSKADLDTFFRLEMPSMRIKKSNRNQCTACSVRKDHQMDYKKRICECKVQFNNQNS